MIMKRDLTRIRRVVMDLDGTIYEGDTLYPQTLPFLDTLTRCGIGWGFVTNNTSRSRKTYWKRLAAMGIPLSSPEQILTPVVSVDAYLRDAMPGRNNLFILGNDDFRAEMQEMGWHDMGEARDARPDAVVTAFDTSLCYERLCRAAWWIRQGVPWLATHPDVFCPTDRPEWLVDCGALTACLETSTGIHCSHVFGKPNPDILQTVMRQFRLAPDELVMAGDRERTDIASGIAAGAVTVRIFTGDRDCAESRADFVCHDLGEFQSLLLLARSSV